MKPTLDVSLRFSVPGDMDQVYEFIPSSLSARPVNHSAPPRPAREVLGDSLGVLVHGYVGHWPLNAFIGPALEVGQLLECLHWIATGRPVAAAPTPAPEDG